MADLRQPREGLALISTHWPSITDPVKFVLRYAPAIRGYLQVLLPPAADADEILQDVPEGGLAHGAVVAAAGEDQQVGLAVAVEVARQETGVVVGVGAGDGEAEAALGTTGRVLVRPSGTEPVLRIMVEARDAQIASSTAARLEDIAKRELV